MQDIRASQPLQAKNGNSKPLRTLRRRPHERFGRGLLRILAVPLAAQPALSICPRHRPRLLACNRASGNGQLDKSYPQHAEAHLPSARCRRARRKLRHRPSSVPLPAANSHRLRRAHPDRRKPRVPGQYVIKFQLKNDKMCFILLSGLAGAMACWRWNADPRHIRARPCSGHPRSKSNTGGK